MARKLTVTDRDRAASIVARFVALIHAWMTHDFEEAASRQKELAESGVAVQMHSTDSEVANA